MDTSDQGAGALASAHWSLQCLSQRAPGRGAGGGAGAGAEGVTWDMCLIIRYHTLIITNAYLLCTTLTHNKT